jgi:hypothetical protein
LVSFVSASRKNETSKPSGNLTRQITSSSSEGAIDEQFPRLSLRYHLVGGEEPDHFGQPGAVDGSLAAKRFVPRTMNL